MSISKTNQLQCGHATFQGHVRRCNLLPLAMQFEINASYRQSSHVHPVTWPLCIFIQSHVPRYQSHVLMCRGHNHIHVAKQWKSRVALALSCGKQTTYYHKLSTTIHVKLLKKVL